MLWGMLWSICICWNKFVCNGVIKWRFKMMKKNKNKIKKFKKKKKASKRCLKVWKLAGERVLWLNGVRLVVDAPPPSNGCRRLHVRSEVSGSQLFHHYSLEGNRRAWSQFLGCLFRFVSSDSSTNRSQLANSWLDFHLSKFYFGIYHILLLYKTVAYRVIMKIKIISI